MSDGAQLVSGHARGRSAPPLTSESAVSNPVYKSSDVNVMVSLARALDAPWLLMAALDQGENEVCVAASFSQAIFASALHTTARVRSSYMDMPCAWIMYQKCC
jgi:hypothetical protein